jgi:CDP-2,3-bis-(O-geranylgeranyl)-sn-glycerol synthase
VEGVYKYPSPVIDQFFNIFHVECFLRAGCIMVIELKLLLILIIANGAPIIARNLFRACCNWPIDGGLKTRQGNPLLGHSKTIRGVIAAVVMATLFSPLLGIHWQWGALIGTLAMIGDLVASFCKRRLGYPPSSHVGGLDYLPESLLPLLVIAPFFPLNLLSILIVTLAFCVAAPLLSRLFYQSGIRRHPY